MERPAKNHDASIKQIPVEAAVLDRFEQVRGSDGLGAGEVGDGARDLEDAVVGAGGQMQFLHGLLYSWRASPRYRSLTISSGI